MVHQCQEISPLTRQQCRNRVYSITEVPSKTIGDGKEDLHLCRLHFSFHLNKPEFRELDTWPVRVEDVSNMQLLYDLHDRSKP